MANRGCSYIRDGGLRCKGRPVNGSDLCVAHHPDYQQVRQAGARRGGKTGGRGRPNVETRSIRDQLNTLYARVESGKVSEKRGAVLCQIAGQMIRAADFERKIREVDDLEQRLREVEDVIEAEREERKRWG